MKNSIIALAVIGSIAAAGSAFAIEPIEGSLNYSGKFNQTSGYGTRSLAGQPEWHVFHSGTETVRELYIRQADGSMELHSRTFIGDD